MSDLKSRSPSSLGVVDHGGRLFCGYILNRVPEFFYALFLRIILFRDDFRQSEIKQSGSMPTAQPAVLCDCR